MLHSAAPENSIIRTIITDLPITNTLFVVMSDD